MNAAAGPIVELTLYVDRLLAAEAEEQLAAHVSEMLALPGVRDARLVAADSDDDGRIRRIACFFLDGDETREEYFADPVGALRALLPASLAGDAGIEVRVLRPVAGDSTPRPRCANCSEVLTGQYCGQCGQRALDRFISLWELLRDAVGDLFELDSRLWRTLIPLATRPGHLTVDYLEGRRARYMPPFRSYLVLSLIFFVVAFFDPQQEFGILAEAPAGATEALPAEAADTPPEEQVDDCDDIDVGDLDDMPPWLAARLTPQRLRQLCERLHYDAGQQEFLQRLLDNIGIALYVLLPLMAFALKLLHPLSRRFYVEHLLFVVHFHAFVFLAMLLQLLLIEVVQWSGSDWGVLVLMLIPLYVLVYLYKGMRRVYRQGRAITLFKYILLLLTYFASFAVMIAIAALFAAFSL